MSAAQPPGPPAFGFAHRRLGERWAEPRRPRSLAPSYLVLPALLALLGGGALSCSRAGGRAQRYDCRCTFLTDFDDPSGQLVVVCQPDQERAEAAAKGCAQSAAPAPVEQCRCSPAGASGSAPCQSGYCHVKEHR
jgi:hypothetical protein